MAELAHFTSCNVFVLTAADGSELTDYATKFIPANEENLKTQPMAGYCNCANSVLSDMILESLERDIKMNDLKENLDQLETARMTSEIVTAFVTSNPMQPDQLTKLIADVYETISGLTTDRAINEEPKQEPAVSVRASIKPDYLVCLEDGKRLKMLKRYLRTNFGMSPEEYRAKWNLPPDYPMVAPNYAAMRAEMAKKIGLGNKGGRKKTKKN